VANGFSISLANPRFSFPILKKDFRRNRRQPEKPSTAEGKLHGRRATEETEFDGSGKITKVDREEHTFSFSMAMKSPHWSPKTASRSDEAQQAKENEKTRKYIAICRKQEPKRTEGRKSRRRRQARKGSGDPGVESFLRACQFVNPRANASAARMF